MAPETRLTSRDLFTIIIVIIIITIIIKWIRIE